MTLLMLGLVLWAAAHMTKRLAPGLRGAMQDRLGDAAKGVIAGALLVAMALMVIGYRGADGAIHWGPTPATTGINNLMMLAAVALFGAGGAKSRLAARLRHPMLTGVVVWAAAHVLVNGDTPSFVLFGGLALWALAAMALINRAEPQFRPPAGSLAGDIRLAAVSVVVFAVIAGLHSWLGHFPFGG